MDLVRKAKQIELLINSLPVLEPEETQAGRFVQLEEEMQAANAEYKAALDRARMPSSPSMRLSHPHVALRETTQRNNRHATNIDRYARHCAELVCRSRLRLRLRESFSHRLYQLAQFSGGDEHCPSPDVRSERVRPLTRFVVRKIIVARVKGDL